MTIKITRLSLAMALLLPASAALAEAVLTPETEQKVRDTLTAQGYEVAKVKIEDGLFEAYAKKEGEKLEIFLNEKMEIVKTEKD
ncbi:PepSY domain-containing protein [Aestuariivirga sp.]|uniref:PepSY domain-containing protein n=1 Tax=Aestuariivirga sp. TaxID=2650926 RepID=UPI00391C5CB7